MAFLFTKSRAGGKGEHMYSTYRLKASELNSTFLETLKKMFKNREIEIVVHDVEDETEYLLSTEANKKHILKAVKNVEKRKNLVHVQAVDL
jgi:antitoxin YefM